jgi:hypothetical protein
MQNNREFYFYVSERSVKIITFKSLYQVTLNKSVRYFRVIVKGSPEINIVPAQYTC